MFQTALQQILFVLFPIGMAYSAAADLLTMTISNRISLALVAIFLLLAPLTGMDWQTFGMHWAAGGAVLAVSFTFFAFGWIGGGDAKLSAAIALWLGWGNTLEFVSLAAVFGGLLTLVILSFRGAVLPAAVVRQPWIARLHDEKAGVPYGVALAAAALAIYPHTIWVKMVTG
ncbi:A24 family peptidase [Bauldia litoralis]|uniref:A24 family peptidase n=1 Tax=Bauldia litoralis TaxID=665467 RepID=UPI003265A5B1